MPKNDSFSHELYLRIEVRVKRFYFVLLFFALPCVRADTALIQYEQVLMSLKAALCPVLEDNGSLDAKASFLNDSIDRQVRCQPGALMLLNKIENKQHGLFYLVSPVGMVKLRANLHHQDKLLQELEALKNDGFRFGRTGQVAFNQEDLVRGYSDPGLYIGIPLTEHRTISFQHPTSQAGIYRLFWAPDEMGAPTISV